MGCNNNCTAWEVGDAPPYKGDPEIDGPGIYWVFVGTSVIALFLSLVHTLLTPAASPDENVIDFWVPRISSLIWDIIRNPGSAHRYIDERKAHVSQLTRTEKRGNEFFSRFSEKVILSLSDQLLLTGTAVLIAGFWTHCSISVYHFTIISNLAWFASSVHLSTIVVLSQYLQDRPVLRNWRAVLMGCMTILLTASIIMQGHREWYSSWPYDAQCVFNDLSFAKVGGSPARWMYANLALIVTGYPPSIMKLYQGPQDFSNKWLRREPEAACYRFIRYCESKRDRITTHLTQTSQAQRFLCSFLIACAETSIKFYIFLYKLLSALYRSRWSSLLFCYGWFLVGMGTLIADHTFGLWPMDDSENAMTFGQIVPILLLGSTLLVAREAYDDIKIDMTKEDLLQGHRSTASLVHTRGISAQGPPPGQSFEMSGALAAKDDHLDRVPSSIGQGGGTEHGSQTSGIDDARKLSETLKRPTWPKYGVARPETARTSSSLREAINPRGDH